MTGSKRILAMRRSGSKPTVVWLTDFADGYVDPEGDAPTVRVAGFTPEALDLRFLVGIPIAIVEGADAQRLARFAAAMQEAGATRVITNQFYDGSVVRITDTEGAMSWPG